MSHNIWKLASNAVNSSQDATAAAAVTTTTTTTTANSSHHDHILLEFRLIIICHVKLISIALGSTTWLFSETTNITITTNIKSTAITTSNYYVRS